MSNRLKCFAWNFSWFYNRQARGHSMYNVHYTFKNSYHVVKFYWMENFDFGSWIMDFPLMKKYHKTTFSIENNYTYNVLIVLDPLDSNKK